MFSTILGGGQENGLRSGTENTPAIAAFGDAVKITFATMDKTVKHMKELRNYCIDSIANQIPKS